MLEACCLLDGHCGFEAMRNTELRHRRIEVILYSNRTVSGTPCAQHNGIMQKARKSKLVNRLVADGCSVVFDKEFTWILLPEIFGQSAQGKNIVLLTICILDLVCRAHPHL